MSFDDFKQLLLQDPFPQNLCEVPLLICNRNKIVDLRIVTDPGSVKTENRAIPLDYIKRTPHKVLAIVHSALGLNKRVFARNCELKKITRGVTEQFLECYHLIGFAQSAFNRGLFYKEELVAVASFSKGRKMNRLPADKRSFELIRFCCKSGITVTGGLTRLVKNFIIEKQAGDVMTYIDKQWSGGQSFLQAGFKIVGQSEPVSFLIHTTTFERVYDTGQSYNTQQFYKIRNQGNLKLVYTPGE